ncbi:MAG: hypothetical protein QXH38_07065 [Candidatus Bathyarchaeia archaeon]
MPEARKCREFLLRISLSEIEAYTSLITWDEFTWIVKKIMGDELSVEYGRKFLRFPNLRFLGELRKRATRLRKGQLIVHHPMLFAPIIVEFPPPPHVISLVA